MQSSEEEKMTILQRRRLLGSHARIDGVLGLKSHQDYRKTTVIIGVHRCSRYCSNKDGALETTEIY